jgi:hypothetical protein
MSTPHPRFLFVLLAVGLAACGSSDDDAMTGAATGGGGGGGAAGASGAGGSGGAAAQGPALEDIPAKFAAVSCELANQCFGETLLKLYLRGEDCVTRTQRSVEDGDLGRTSQLVGDKKLSYDPAKAQACLDAYKATGCAQLDTRQPDVCQDVFGGKGVAGDPCEVNAECAGSTFCEAGAACPGKCAALKEAGGACSSDDACAAGLKCSNGKCVAPAAENGACEGSTGAPCKAGLACASADGATGKAGMCKPNAAVLAAKIGDPCDPLQQQLCEPAATCELVSAAQAGLTWKCVARYASGAPCKISVTDGCPDDEYCPVNTKSTPPKFDGVCTKRPGPGEDCGLDTNGGPSVCAAYSVCTAGKCVSKQRLGGPCSSEGECYSERCKGAKCVAGTACEPSSQPGP